MAREQKRDMDKVKKRECQEFLKKEEFKVVDVKDYINELCEKDKEVKQYQKFQKVNAVQGEPGQEVITKMANGLEETKNVVKIDEKTGEPGWIVTNPSGEQYIVEDSKFTARYDVENAKNGVYEPKFEPIKAIEIEDNITFTAPWGEKMNIAKGGYLVINSPDDIYGIQKEEFFETYQELNQYLENKKQQEKVKSKSVEQSKDAGKEIKK